MPLTLYMLQTHNIRRVKISISMPLSTNDISHRVTIKNFEMTLFSQKAPLRARIDDVVTRLACAFTIFSMRWGPPPSILKLAKRTYARHAIAKAMVDIDYVSSFMILSVIEAEASCRSYINKARWRGQPYISFLIGHKLRRSRRTADECATSR